MKIVSILRQEEPSTIVQKAIDDRITIQALLLSKIEIVNLKIFFSYG